jgi:outer membrane protein assembly factor BamB
MKRVRLFRRQNEKRRRDNVPQFSRRQALLAGGAALAFGAFKPVPLRAAPDDAAPVQPADTDWPWWRGPRWDGCAVGDLPPLEWSETKNVLWKVAVPGRGHATPCLWGERIFLATADEERQIQSLICCDRATGRTRWQTEVHAGGFMRSHDKNSHASATPACDGERVFVVFYREQAIWATALDFGGEILWQKKVGSYNERYGYGSSPTICGDALIVAGDSQAEGFLAALKRGTGDEIWRAERPNLPSYGPPVVATIGGRQQLLVQGNRVAGYDPQTGRELWQCAAPARATACALCFDERRVYASGGYPERRVYCIAADGQGDVSESHIQWRHERGSGAAYVPSPLMFEGRLYVISDGGMANCFRADDGHQHFSVRLGGDFSASPTLIGQHLIAPYEEGKSFVFKAVVE